MILINHSGTIPSLPLNQLSRYRKMSNGVIGVEVTETTEVGNSPNSQEIREEEIDNEELIIQTKDSKIVESNSFIDIVIRIKIVETISIETEKIVEEDLEEIFTIVERTTGRSEKGRRASRKASEETEITIIMETQTGNITIIVTETDSTTTTETATDSSITTAIGSITTTEMQIDRLTLINKLHQTQAQILQLQQSLPKSSN